MPGGGQRKEKKRTEGIFPLPRNVSWIRYEVGIRNERLGLPATVITTMIHKSEAAASPEPNRQYTQAKRLPRLEDSCRGFCLPLALPTTNLNVSNAGSRGYI